jgi:hypothetical protein
MKGVKGMTDVYGSDRPEYAEWMSKRSYYARMIKKFQGLVDDELTRSLLVEAKLKKYQEMFDIATERIEEARIKYGIKRRVKVEANPATDVAPTSPQTEDTEVDSQSNL